VNQLNRVYLYTYVNVDPSNTVVYVCL